jgi:hypothetical protein
MNELAVVEGKPTPYGDRNEIKEISQRLQKMMPGTQRLTETEALTVAQIAVAHNLDPFNGEVWGLKSRDGKWYGVMVGVKGLRKCARREAKKENSDFWLTFKLADPERYNAEKNSVVYECHLRDTVSFQAWAKSFISMKAAGVSEEFIENALGPAPVVIGVGIARPNERSEMEIHARARKRAEADALKQRYNVEFRGAHFQAEAEADGYIDAEVSEVADDEPDLLDEPRGEGEILTEMGYDVEEEPKIERPYSPQQLKEKIKECAERYGRERGQASDRDRKVLAKMLTTTFGGDNTKRYELSKWLFGEASTKKMDDAMVLAGLRWFEVKDFDDLPDSKSIQEAKSALAEALKADGQQELEFGEDREVDNVEK